MHCAEYSSLELARRLTIMELGIGSRKDTRHALHAPPGVCDELKRIKVETDEHLQSCERCFKSRGGKTLVLPPQNNQS